MTDIAEAEKLAIEEAAREEGRANAERDAAIALASEQAAEAARETEWHAESLRYTDEAVGEIRVTVGALAEQVMNLTATVEVLVAAKIEAPEIEDAEETTETPPPAIEPAKRIRKWS